MASNRESGAHVMVSPGMIEVRTVYGVKQHVPNRFTEAGFPSEGEDDDYTGWVWWEGKKTPVETGYWGGALVWKIADPA